MKISYLSLGSIIILASALSAVPSAINAQNLNCESPQTTLESKQCLGIELDAVDGELNRVYNALRADQDDEANELLKAAQRAWITYRDTECARVADVVRGGTLAGVLELSCHVDLTKTRTEELALNPVTGDIKY